MELRIRNKTIFLYDGVCHLPHQKRAGEHWAGGSLRLSRLGHGRKESAPKGSLRAAPGKSCRRQRGARGVGVTQGIGNSGLGLDAWGGVQAGAVREACLMWGSGFPSERV